MKTLIAHSVRPALAIGYLTLACFGCSQNDPAPAESQSAGLNLTQASGSSRAPSATSKSPVSVSGRLPLGDGLGAIPGMAHGSDPTRDSLFSSQASGTDLYNTPIGADLDQPLLSAPGDIGLGGSDDCLRQEDFNPAAELLR